jgi:membrane-associated phospholipid phosphatase
LGQSVPPSVTGLCDACVPADSPGFTGEEEWGDFSDEALNDADFERGPVLSVWTDLRNGPPMIRNDLRAIVTWRNAAMLGVAAGGAVLLSETLDDRVRANTLRHAERWGEFSSALGTLGEPLVQGPVLTGLYGYSLWQQDAELHHLSVALITSYKFSGLGSLAIQGATHVNRPVHEWFGGEWAFPSESTATSFAIAATFDQFYGWRAALPAYTLAGLLGWSRIDEREHDLSAVFFGAAFGYVIGKSIAAEHLQEQTGVRIRPYSDPSTNASGILLEKPF